MNKRVYSVSLSVDLEIMDTYVDWMKNVHIPDVLATGCFSGALMHQVHEPEQSGRAGFRVDYYSSQRQLQDYLQNHAAALRQDPIKRFGGRFSASRTITSPMADFEADPG